MSTVIEFGSRITGIVQAVFEAIMEKNPNGLQDSRHAPKKTEQSNNNNPSSPSASPSSSSPSHSSPPPNSPFSSLPPTPPTNNLDSFKSSDSIKMALADVDDTAGFMAAARSVKLDQSNYMTATSAAEDNASSSDQANSKDGEGFEESAEAHDLTSTTLNDFNSNAPDNEANESLDKDAASLATDAGGMRIEEEDRENLTTFKTWGTPDVRDKPAARVRSVIIKALPAAWANPSKVLSLVHGGAIEKITVSNVGIANVIFCEADACQAFYDKYPNGIDLDKERKITAFVEIGREVNVISSQLLFSLSIGATRAVRAVGVNMDIHMGRLVELASAHNWRIEKILDYYVPGDARTVVFRFCGIDDAVRFRAMLQRDADWEHCNLQYTTDPCEKATGYHTD